MRGFSLIEVLIAAALLGIMGMILMTTLNASFEIKEKAENISEQHHLIRQALARMSQEISMAYISANRNPINVVVDTQFQGEKNRISFVAFGGLQHRQDSQESGEREISYFVENENLMRREKNNPGSQIFRDGKANKVCPRVLKLEFKYFNPTTRAWDSEWKTQGQPIQTATLPPQVKIELTAKFKEDEVEKVVTQSQIWLTTPIFLVAS